MRVAGHEMQEMQRYSRGRSAVFGRPQVGYVVSCSCGWSARVNGTKREARPYFTGHLMTAKKEATR